MDVGLAVRVFDLLELDASGASARDGKPVALAIVMELLRGETLGERIKRVQTLPLKETLELASQFISALGHAHGEGIVHRDLTPENIFLATDLDGRVEAKVLDFGVAKVCEAGVPQLTSAGMKVGTPTFMSPEQAEGSSNVDARSDVFSAAVLVYIMLAGSNPFAGEGLAEVVHAILERDPPPIPGVPPPIMAVLERALAKDPARRYADATKLAAALRDASANRSGEAVVENVAPDETSEASEANEANEANEPRKERALALQRKRIVLAASVIGVLTVIGLVGIVLAVCSTPPSETASEAPSGFPSIPSAIPSATPSVPASVAPSATETAASATEPAVTASAQKSITPNASARPTVTAPAGRRPPPRPRDPAAARQPGF